MGLGTKAIESRNTSAILDGNAEDQKKRIPELTDWLKRLEELIKQIRDNFSNANNTLKEVVKPFPKFDDLISKLGMFLAPITLYNQTAGSFSACYIGRVINKFKYRVSNVSLSIAIGY